jgi:hypothetical protein
MKNLVYDRLRQHADYTHKYNLKTGRHGWLRLTPAYSVRIVEEFMNQTEGHLRVFDPFCGTATTALSAAYHGHDAVTIDINPFLVWLGQAKVAHYSSLILSQTCSICEDILSLIGADGIEPSPPPPIHHIDRWWTPKMLNYLCRLQAAIDRTVSPETPEGTLLRVAFCRTLIECSNAAFNHQSMSFKDTCQLELDIQPDYMGLFRENVAIVLKGAAENPTGKAQVILHDARDLSTFGTKCFELVVTSPPYANRMSYIRELRPYMYWMRFLVNGRDAGELDWLAIGGTWGIATSRLNDWKPEGRTYISDELEETLARIAAPSNANGALLATYIRKYCVDMAKHFAELRAILRPGARLHYIVGNSTFYGELLSIEKSYANIMGELGFRHISILPIRKRNSKKELVEFLVSAVFE